LQCVSYLLRLDLQAKLKMTGKSGRYSLYDIFKIGYVDIEATNLKAQIGHILSIVNVVRDVQTDKVIDTRVYRVSKAEMESSLKRGVMDCDKRIIKEFFEDAVDCDMLVGHWFHGRKRFDMPFLRTRAMLLKIDDTIPNYGYWRFGDTWRLGSQTLNSLGYRLNTLGQILGSPVEKTKLSGVQWWLASHCDKRGMDYVVDHNVKDCKITMKVHKMLERFNPIPSGRV